MALSERSRLILSWAWAITKWVFVGGVLAGLLVLLILTKEAEKTPAPPKSTVSIVLYDGGKAVGKWTTEKYTYSDTSASIRFVDKSTGAIVRIHGTYTITIPKTKEKEQ